MLVCCAHKELASNPSYSADKCASRSSHMTVAQSGPCRPMCGPLSLVSCVFVQLRMRDACAQPAASLGSGRQPQCRKCNEGNATSKWTRSFGFVDVGAVWGVASHPSATHAVYFCACA
jgi:hypothetical protein